jgi:flavin reductase (DIM6/NTAB) family NADH-FMN oxidoreductase RutF
MEVDPKRLQYLNAPAPCVLVSTVNDQGRRNVAAYGYWTPADLEVPSVMFGARDFQHTFKNAKATREFVIGLPTADLAAKVWKAGNKDEECADEFVECSLTPVPSKTVRPFRIAECPINLECELMFSFAVGVHNWLVGKVRLAEVDDGLHAEENWQLRNNLDGLYHLSKGYFCRRGELIVVDKARVARSGRLELG